MARQSIFDSRKSLLDRLLKQQAALRDRPERLAQMQNQLAMLEAQQFPDSVVTALRNEIRRVEMVAPDETLDVRVAALQRWVNAETECNAMFPPPQRRPRDPMSTRSASRRYKTPRNA